MLIAVREHGPPALFDRNTLHTLVWAKATLRYSLSDVFEVFDCCYAGDLGRTAGEWRQGRSEYLAAATGSGLTSAPGKYSFTSAFTWALKELAGIRTGFTTSELVHQIRQAPNFPDGQWPVLLDRAESLKRIVLAPLAKDTINSNAEQSVTDDKKDDKTNDCKYLELRLVLDRHPSISEFEDFAKTMNVLCSRKDGLPVSRVVWGALPFSQASTNHESFKEPIQKTGISPRVDRAVMELKSKLLRDQNLAEKAKTKGQSAEVLPAAKIVEHHREDLGVEDKSLVHSAIFRRLIILILYISCLYFPGQLLRYNDAFKMYFCIIVIYVSPLQL